jgi:putative membrane protein
MPRKRLSAHKGDLANLARDHLANERTYLAWLRTAVSVMVLGLIVAKFIDNRGPLRAELAGIVLIGIGFLLLLYGTERSRRLTHQLETGRFTTDRHGPLIIAGVVMIAMFAALLLLVV